VTLKEIAARVGVSRPAVSAALSDRVSTIVLSAPLREKIRRTAAEMGYRRNLLAESFTQQRSFLVGVLGRREFALYAMDLMAGIEPVLDARGVAPLAFLHGATADDQERQLQRCLDRRVDGLIVAGAPGGRLPARIEELRRKKFPIVQLFRPTFSKVPVFGVDDEQVGLLQTRYAIELGHRRIVHVTHDEVEASGKPIEHRDARGRLAGYARAMREAGLKPVSLTFPASKYFPLVGGGSPGAADCAARLLGHSGRFTAAVCFSDYVAIGLLRGVGALGRRVPADLSVVGMDDVEMASASEPALTTLAPPIAAIGRAAAGAVLDLLDGKRVSNCEFEPEIVPRASTAPVR
jgi:LacI family transcriptional regulator